MDIKELRENIDDIDKKLTELFARRMDVASKIAEYKKNKGLPVLDPVREREKLSEISKMTPDELKDYSELLYSLIFELSRDYQTRILGNGSELTEKIEKAVAGTPSLFPEQAFVACQGVAGSNSQFACDRLFRRASIMYFSSFEAVFKAIEKGLCRYGVIPVENSTAGSVNSVYDLMMTHKFSIVRSVRVKIEHCLLANEGTKLEDIKEIYSHEQAISQCSSFLGELKNVKIIPCENTAVAAKMVAESGRKDIAALASRQCMSFYGLKSLKDSVQNTENNYTRFICISKELEIYPGADRTSVMLTLPHVPGSLYKLLARFYAVDVNINKLESRPLPGREFEFMFYFDFDTPVYSPRLLRLLGELPGLCEQFSYLGSYSEVI
ncbi:MAG: bifunctional chorismate mutase/prephenate dehydratase [Clostridia bacterium]|nr:bifunctional chorismate mutase/prephenate dehydratase [Clostridia bacterium]MCR5694024.1 bifunctional chorismate mutase/prephenate dehydratase [Clostridia bacterium]